MWEIIFEIIEETADSHCPYKNIKFKESTPQWVTKDILLEVNHKDHLFSRAKREDTEESWKRYREKKNEVKKLLATARENLVKNKLDELVGNPR